MRTVSSELQSRLDSGVTTLCHCWKLVRGDNAVQGFTDHDRDVVLDGVTYRAGTGFTASEATSRFDLSSAGGEVSGVLADATLNEAELAAGLYDAARVETWLVDWDDPALRLLLFRGTVFRNYRSRSCVRSAGSNGWCVRSR